MTTYEEKDNYGKYYQLLIFFKNLSERPVIFNPEEVTATLSTKHGDSIVLKVYSYNQYMGKIKSSQSLNMILTAVSAGLNAGTAGYSTTYTTTYNNGVPYTQISTHYDATAASTANAVAQTQIATLHKLQEEDIKAKEQGYLKLNTIDPNEAIVGHINVKWKRGITLTVDIPIEGQVFHFDWDVMKNK